ncbi:HNH endonuclease [mine drainage metagenome]|uniref:HNH endonuclease n=1 Tax=mine drainage metagenome TaxID=410659 RepID=A0A1J5RQL4_9ZZZZ
MKIYVVRLNPDTRGCLPYSKHPTAEEYRSIHEIAPMDGFHEAVNFLPENGIVRGYLPPRHSAGMRDGEPFVLVSITAKTARIGGDEIVGIQAGCRYEGETPRRGGTRATQELDLSWHYSCPASMSMLFDQPIPGARNIVLGQHGGWVRGPTFEIKKAAQKRLIDNIGGKISAGESRKRFEKMLSKAGKGTSGVLAEELEAESTFESDVIDAFHKDLTNVRGNRHPTQKEVRSFAYERDPFVVAYALKKANGFCQECEQEGPFVSRATGLPYLEVHHLKMLKDGGSDTVDNVIALCPNCHRAMHHG